MTRREIMDQIWVAIGKPTEYDPEPTSVNYDTSYNGGPFLAFVANEGQRQVAKWKAKESGRPIRISDLFSSFHYASYVGSDTIASVNNSTDPYYIGLTSSLAIDSAYEGWIVKITSGTSTGNVGYIYSYSGASRTAYLSEALPTTPAVGDTVSLYKKFDLILPPTHSLASLHLSSPATSDESLNTGNLLEILSITDVVNGKELEPVTKQEKFPGNLEILGTPSYWYHYGNAIYYDVNVDTKLRFRVEYYRTPTDMDADASNPDIPNIWHMAIVLWGRWYMLQRKMEAGLAYAAKMTSRMKCAELSPSLTFARNVSTWADK
jgi:hypothetical protein